MEPTKNEKLNTILRALHLSRDDLLIQKMDHEKYAPAEDLEEILDSIDFHLDLIADAEIYTKELIGE